MKKMGLQLSPVQLDFGTPLDTKAAAHAVRLYLANLPPTSVLVKFDFKNAFNSIKRDNMLEAAKQHLPEPFPLIYSCYSASGHDIVIQSAKGVQQGDPLGPLLFCLVIYSLTLKLRSEPKVVYL